METTNIALENELREKRRSHLRSALFPGISGWSKNPSFGHFSYRSYTMVHQLYGGIYILCGDQNDKSATRSTTGGVETSNSSFRNELRVQRRSHLQHALFPGFSVWYQPQLWAFILTVLPNGPPAIWRDIHFRRGLKWFQSYKKYHSRRWNVR